MRIYCFHKGGQCDLFEKLTDQELQIVYSGAKQELKMRRLLIDDKTTGKVQSKNTTDA